MNSNLRVMIKKKRANINYYYIVIEMIIMFIFFLFEMWYTPHPRYHFYKYIQPYIIFCIIRIVIGLINSKYKDIRNQTLSKSFRNITTADFVSIFFAYVFIYFNKKFNYSPQILEGLILATYIFEILLISTLYAFKRSMEADSLTLQDELNKLPEVILPLKETHIIDEITQKRIENIIIEESGIDVYKFLLENSELNSSETIVVSTTTRFNVLNQPQDYYNTIINLKKINDTNRINKFFETVNMKLAHNGIFVGFVETKNLRKHRILNKFFPPFNYLYYIIDFLLKRVAPKFFLTKNLYFLITGGNNRVITKAETFGRLYSCGFEIVNEQVIGNYMYFVVRKIREPLFPQDPTYGPIIKLRRVGKDGKIFNVYKMRTMHPYAEYLQAYIFDKNQLEEGGKFKNDFRVSTIGKIMRKFWLDELPMIVNWLQGDMKLVGVRPLSKHYYSLYKKELQQRRVEYKPGLVPPFYADMPKTLEEIMESETKYLDAYDKSPLFTDIRYFFKAFWNIIVKKARSA